MRKIIFAISLTLLLAGCAGLQQATGIYNTVTTTTVPASVVIPAANAFDILKGTATNYGRYCISKQMAPAVCSAAIRRVVVKSVRSGTAARNQLEDSVKNGQPALASVYNVLVTAVTALQKTPAADPTFVGAQ